MRYRLPKAERIHGKSSVNNLFEAGKRFTEPPFRVFWQLKNKSTGAPFRFGIAVPKKVRKPAHERNQIKRQVREAIRLSVGELRVKLLSSGNQLDFFLVFTGREPISGAEIRTKIILILKRLIQINEAVARQDSDRVDSTL